MSDERKILVEAAVNLAVTGALVFALFYIPKHMEQRQLVAQIQQCMVPRGMSPLKWSDVVGLETAKESLKESILLPLRTPHLF